MHEETRGGHWSAQELCISGIANSRRATLLSLVHHTSRWVGSSPERQVGCFTEASLPPAVDPSCCLVSWASTGQLYGVSATVYITYLSACWGR